MASPGLASALEMTTTNMMLMTILNTCSSVSTSHSCGFIYWAGFLKEARGEVDNLLEQKMVE